MIVVRPILDPVASRADAATSRGRGDVEDQREIGQEPPRRRQADLGHVGDAEAARQSLIDDVGEQVTVRDDNLALLREPGGSPLRRAGRGWP